MTNSKSKSFVSNVMILLSAQIIVKLLGMIYRMVITNINGFGDAGNGFYSAGFQVYTLLLALSSVGIPNAISKLISEKIALSDYDGVNKISKTALCIFSFIGMILSIGLFFLSDPIAKFILNMEGAKYTLAALSPSIFFVCVSSVFRGYFSGINKMQVMSISQIIEQVFKSVLTILFVLAAVGNTAEIMSAYANFATTVATIFGTLYLIYAYKYKKDVRQIAPANKTEREFFSVAKKILVIAVPVSLCSGISAMNRMIDTATITRGIEEAFQFCIPAHTDAAAILNPTAKQLNAEAVRLSGMLSKSDTLINLPLALNIALATVLVPSISKCAAAKNTLKINEYIHSSFLTSVVLILPCAAGYIILAKPIYHLIYPNASLGFELLQFSTISLVFTAFNQTITGALQGMGKVYVPAAALAVGCIVKLAVNLMLLSIPQINIYGAVIGSAVCQITVFIIEFYSMFKSLPGGIKIRNIFLKPLLCSLLMSIAAYYTYQIGYIISKSNLMAIIVSICSSVIIYGALILWLKVFSKEQLAKIPAFGRMYVFFENRHIRNN